MKDSVPPEQASGFDKLLRQFYSEPTMPALVAGIEPWALPATKQMSELGERPALRRTVFDWVALRPCCRAGQRWRAMGGQKTSVDRSSRLVIEDY